MTCPRCGSRCWWKRPTSCQACGYVPERAHTDPGYARSLREGRALELAREEARGRVTADDRAIGALMEGIAQ